MARTPCGHNDLARYLSTCQKIYIKGPEISNRYNRISTIGPNLLYSFPFFYKNKTHRTPLEFTQTYIYVFLFNLYFFCLYMISRQGHFDEWMRTAIGFPIKYGGLGFVGVSLQSDLQKYATYI